MATYYCDLAAAFADATGADHAGNEYTGPGGFQAAIRGTGNATALVAGDTLQLTGTADESTLVKLSCGDDVVLAGWTLGDAVRNNTGSGDDWTGTICQLSVGADDTVILAQTLTGDYSTVDTADGIENTTQVDTSALVAKACEGILLDTNEGSAAAGHIKIVGVSAAWANDGTLAVLDGDSDAADCITIANKDYHWLENLELKNPSASGLNFITDYSSFCLLNNLHIHDTGSHGIESTGGYFLYGLALNLRIHDCGSRGFYLPGNRSRLFGGSVIGNGSYGLELTKEDTNVVGYIIHANGSNGVCLYHYRQMLAFCVVDGNGGHNVSVVAGRFAAIIGCRITNAPAGKYGINADAADRLVYENWNYFEDNAAGNRNNVDAGPNSLADQADVDEGYAGRAADNLMLAPGATGYRTEIDIDGVNTVRFSMGLPTILKRIPGPARA